MRNPVARELLLDIAATLDALLRVRYAGETDQPRRDALALGYLSNEVRRLISGSPPRQLPVRSMDDLLTMAGDLTLADIAVIRHRCLFYGCDDLIALLVGKRIRTDAIAREEAVLYIQDRLQRDDFRRIRSFQTDRGASFVTYMWQVVNNLLLDFLRARSKLPTKLESIESESHDDSVQQAVDSDTAHGLGTAASTVETLHEAQQLHEMLVELMAESDATGVLQPIREQLRPHLKLSSKERVFLKAMFQYDLTINEIRELPGFAMSVNEAYRFYYRIMEQLLDSFKNAGILDSMRSLVSAAAPRVSLSANGNMVTVPATGIYYLEQFDRASTRCHIDWQGATVLGTIHESFSKLSKRLAAYFSPIDATTAVADKILAASSGQWAGTGVLHITGIGRTFRIGKRYLVALRKRFAENSSRPTRI